MLPVIEDEIGPAIPKRKMSEDRRYRPPTLYRAIEITVIETAHEFYQPSPLSLILGNERLIHRD